jgi:integrase
MPRKAAGLSAAKVAKAKPGRYGDGRGLYVFIRGPEQKFWIFRYRINGRSREAGLGPAAGPGAVSLAEARQRAHHFRDQLFHGIDPIEARKAGKAAQLAQAALEKAKAVTFGDVAECYLKAHEASWRNRKHRLQWRNTIIGSVKTKSLVNTIIGGMPVAAVDTGSVMRILESLWREKPETASRVRGRIESILDYAKVSGWRDGENPARWRGHLEKKLPNRSKVRDVQHHAALPWREIGAFMAALRLQTNIAARALEFLILTAVRSGEVLGARWNEIDWECRVWAIPAARMKASREHRVPLSEAAMAVLRHLASVRLYGDSSALIFPGARIGKQLSGVSMSRAIRITGAASTVHGMRSTFRDWCGESTNFPREIAEAALAHAVGSAVEQAYRRGDALEKRRRLMEAWGQFCGRTASAKVLPLSRESQSA